MIKFEPSYDNYKQILKSIKSCGKCMSYKDALNADEFLILRHDIEFSIERAYKMAVLETEECILSTYFIQITSNAYNPFSEKNLDMIDKILNMGHQIGLHYHLGKNKESTFICNEIKKQSQILAYMIKSPVEIFSIHRPTEDCDYHSIVIDGIINAYSRDFFTHNTNITADTELDVKYIADSKHQWNYGYPNIETISRNSKIQLLIHPYSWSVVGEDKIGVFQGLAIEKEKELFETFDKETKIYKTVKKYVERDRKR